MRNGLEITSPNQLIATNLLELPCRLQLQRPDDVDDVHDGGGGGG